MLQSARTLDVLELHRGNILDDAFLVDLDKLEFSQEGVTVVVGVVGAHAQLEILDVVQSVTDGFTVCLLYTSAP